MRSINALKTNPMLDERPEFKQADKEQLKNSLKNPSPEDQL